MTSDEGGGSDMPSKALVLSTGGSVEPLVFSIGEIRPRLCVFLASNESLPAVVEVKKDRRAASVRCRWETVVVSDPGDLLEAYRKGLEAVRIVKDKGFAAGQTIVDITGGTKAMSAGLALATVREGFTFSYISGEKRDSGGLGTVVSGTEVMREFANVFDFLAREEMRLICHQVNTCQWTGAVETIDRVLGLGSAASAEFRKWLPMLREIVEGYSHWDRFEHREAVEKLTKHLEGLSHFARGKGDAGLEAFVASAKENLAFLQKLQEETRGFKPGVLVQSHIVDLVANAARRAEEGKLDDAVARLYRALEMVAQVAFRARFKCDTDDVPEGKVPESLRTGYNSRFRSEGRMKLPMDAAFRMLACDGDETGLSYEKRKGDIKKVQLGRNDSILAHGVTALKREDYERIRGIVVTFAAIDEAGLPSFAKLNL